MREGIVERMDEAEAARLAVAADADVAIADEEPLGLRSPVSMREDTLLLNAEVVREDGRARPADVDKEDPGRESRADAGPLLRALSGPLRGVVAVIVDEDEEVDALKVGREDEEEAPVPRAELGGAFKRVRSKASRRWFAACWRRTSCRCCVCEMGRSRAGVL